MTLPFRVQKRHLLLFYKHATTFGVDDLSAFIPSAFKEKDQYQPSNAV